jgi:hypothetical protein
MILISCSPKAISNLHHDAQNPCQYGQHYFNPAECERWQKKYPQEYAKYLTRLKNYHDSKIVTVKTSGDTLINEN